MTHWNSPQFHAYYPTANSYPAIIGELLSAGIGGVGFSWISSPACTELEVVTMNWLGKMLGLPKEFLNCSDGPGGGVIQVINKVIYNTMKNTYALFRQFTPRVL